MKAVAFSNILHGVSHLAGIDPDDLQDNQAAAFTEFINEALRAAWETDAFWPWSVQEQRRYRDAWSASTTYAEGDEVWHAATDQYWLALDASTNITPGSDDTKWEACTPAAWLSLTPADYDEIGDVTWVYDEDFLPCDFRLLGERLIILSNPAPAYPIIEYTLPAPVFTSTAWATGTTYAAGDLVYLASTGQTYKALTASTGSNPATNPNAWAVVEFPAILAAHVKQAAYAQHLETDGQTDRSLVASGKAKQLLEAEIDKVFLKSQQIRKFRVIR